MRKCLVALCLSMVGCGASPPTVAIRGASVVDVMDGSVRTAQTVLIEGDRIAAVGPAGTLRIPDNASVIEGEGSYVIPGLWNMHTHHFRSPDGLEAELARHVLNGVLGVRDLGIPVDSIPRLLEVANSPMLRTPRVRFSGPFLEGSDVYSSIPGSIVVADTSAARVAVEMLAAAGVSSIKVHDLLSPELYASIMRAAHASDLPVVGHVPLTLTTDQVIAAGQRSIEHLGQHHGPFADCSTDARLDRETSSRLLTDSLYFAYFFRAEFLEPLLAGFDPDRCADLAQRLAAAEVWQVPTLVVWREWAEGVPWVPAEGQVHLREALELALRITAILNEAGVPIMAGTDNVGTVHDELELLVKAGLTPLEALQTATLNPARFVGLIDELGTVEDGKLADLVLLDANPLHDITGTRTIRGVVVKGRFYRRAELDSVVAALDAASADR